MTHARLVTAATARQVRAATRADRLGGTLAGIVADALKDALASVPDKDHPLRAGWHADAVKRAVQRLRAALARDLAAGLEATARWGHARTAAMLTARVKHTLPVRRPVREDPFAAAGLGDYEDYVIDPPAEWLIRFLAGPAPAKLTSLIDPDRAAGVVYRGVAAGHDRRRIARDLSAEFDGYAASARRVARTAGLQVATQTQLAASETLAGMIPAYQILSVLDNRVRPAHKERHGRLYHRVPKPGQFGFELMPQPPIDQPGNRLQFNCRCYLIPCFDDEPAPSAVPDAPSMARWFDAASPREQRMVTGADVWDAAVDRDGTATWAGVTDAATGGLSPLR